MNDNYQKGETVDKGKTEGGRRAVINGRDDGRGGGWQGLILSTFIAYYLLAVAHCFPAPDF
jgi:hypothetical protein